MERQQMERCLERVAAYRPSAQPANVCAQANGVQMREPASWCAHSRRSRARLDGVSAAPSAAVGSSGFVAARVAVNTAWAAVRVALNAGAARLQLH
jgi:hypothetical protein